MTPTEFAIVQAALRIALNPGSDPLRHQVRRLVRHLDEIGDRAQAEKFRALLDPPADPYPGAKVVQS